MAPRRDAKTAHGIGAATFVAFLASFFILLNWHFPAVGHDYGFVLAGLLEGSWHFHHQGLSIPRYALHLCGGSVLYGHPLDQFYSPTQALALVMDPWIAINFTLGLALVVGYLGWYRAGSTILGLAKEWAHVLALVMAAHGFYFVHVFAGHFTYHAFSLVGWFFLLLFQRSQATGWLRVRETAAFALLCGYVFYSGNWFVFYLCAIAWALALPLDLYLSRQPRRRLAELARRLALFGLAALAVMASKLVAIASFLRFFPRTFAPDYQDPERSTLAYIVKALWAIPQPNARFEGIPGNVQEKSFLLGPITAVGVVLGFVHLARSARRRRGWERAGLVGFAAVYGGVSLLAMVHLVQGYGWLAELVHRLPVASSQHVSTRYLYPFSLLLAVAGVWSVARAMRSLDRRWNRVATVLAGLTTVAAFVLAYARVLPEIELLTNVEQHRMMVKRFDPSVPVTTVVEETDFVAGTPRTCYDPILNFSDNPFHVLHRGSVWDRSDGYFNLMNPACYQYPEENGCNPGQRIAVDDAENLSRFVSGRPVTWRISTAQRIADVVSLLAVLAVLALLVAFRYARPRAGSREDANEASASGGRAAESGEP